MELTDNAGNTWNISAGDTGCLSVQLERPQRGCWRCWHLPRWRVVSHSGTATTTALTTDPTVLATPSTAAGAPLVSTGTSPDNPVPQLLQQARSVRLQLGEHRWCDPQRILAYYPYHYWGFGTYSWAGWSVMVPPGSRRHEQLQRLCDYAYSYYMSSGQGARVTFPSWTSPPEPHLCDDVHRRPAQPCEQLPGPLRVRGPFGNDPADLGDYKRESGTPLFKDGTINGADIGVEIGGDFAAGHLDTVEVNSPNDAGIMVDGSTMARPTASP